MFNCLYVEDEALAREHIQKSVIWNEKQFTLSAIVGDGRQALMYLENGNIDIVITDIRMPFMDGLELSRQIQENHPEVKIVIVSGYTDFNYAKQAISFGVIEYIVKPVRSKELLNALNRVAEKITFEREFSKLQRQEQIRSLLESRSLQQRFLLDLSMGLIPHSDILKYAETAGIRMGRDYFCVVSLNILYRNESDSTIRELFLLDDNRMYPEEVQNNESILHFSRDSMTKFIIFMDNDRRRIGIEAESTTNKIYEHLKKTLINFDALTIHAYISHVCMGTTELMSTLLKMARWDSILNSARSGEKHQKSIIKLENLNFNLYDKLNIPLVTDQLDNLLKFGKKSHIATTIDNIFNYLNQDSQLANLNPLSVLISNIDIILTVKTFIQSLQGDFESFKKQYNLCTSLSPFLSTTDKDELLSNITSLLEAAIDFRDSLLHSRYHDVILRAKEYVDRHFVDYELSLKTVAEKFNISSNYFSTLFSKEVGQSFLEYTISKRISFACELLASTNRNVTEVAFNSGYNDSNYFSRAFKEIIGLSPRSYRLKIRGCDITHGSETQEIQLIK